MDSKKIIITGANGYIGKYLTETLENRGHIVTRFVRRPRKRSTDVAYELNSELDESSFKGHQVLIHCAFVPNQNQASAFEQNIAGTEKLLALCEKHNLKFIFVSSLSAHPKAESEYGRHKAYLESKINQEKHAIIQPGLVIGSGGLFGRIKDFSRKFRIIPLIDRGRQPFQFIALGDVAEAILKIIEYDYRGKFVLVSDERLTYLDFYRALAKSQKIHLFFVNLPVNLILFGLGTFEKIKIKLPVNKENLLGLKKMQYINPGDDMKKLEIIPEKLSVLLDTLEKS